MYLQQKKWDQAADYYQKISKLDPNDPETYYSIAVIDWSQTYQRRMDERAKLGLKPTDELKDKKDCNELLKTIKAQNEPQVEDGIQNLKKALELRPDYDDAMAYLNLLYRERPTCSATTPTPARPISRPRTTGWTRPWPPRKPRQKRPVLPAL